MNELTDSVARLTEHLANRQQEIGDLLLQRYKEKIVEYRSLPEGFLEQDIGWIAQQNLVELLASVSSDEPETHVNLETFKNSAVRRSRQGVPVQALLHAYRLWGHTVWQEVMRTDEVRRNPQAGLVMAGRIMAHVDVVSSAVAQAYLEAATGVIQDQELAQRELLEQLIAGDGIGERTENMLKRFGINPQTRILVILVRHRQLARHTHNELSENVRYVRAHLAPRGVRAPLIGLRDEEIVVVAPLGSRELVDVRTSANALAVDLPEFTVGLSRLHDTLAGVTTGYEEAQDAIRSARSCTRHPRAYAFADALLHHVLQSSAYRAEIHEETILPLQRYDRQHNTELVETLRAFVDARFNLSQTATEVHIQPNTVRYRLKRIRQITGRNPGSADDLILLALGIRLL